MPKPKARSKAEAEAEDARPDWKETPLKAQAKTLGDLISRKVKADVERKKYETEAKDLSDRIVTLLISSGVEKTVYEDIKVTVCSQPGRETISRSKLIELGVSKKIIKKATNVGSGYSYALVTPPEDPATAGKK